jgi:hypothetical protein
MVIADVAIFRKAHPTAGNEYANHPHVSSLNPSPSVIASIQNSTPMKNSENCMAIKTGRYLSMLL